MFARRAAVAVTVTAAILLTGAASSALESPPPLDEPAGYTAAPDSETRPGDTTPQHPTPQHPTPQQPAPPTGPDDADGAHHVQIHVSGPDDTLMRVIRDRRGSGVALGGKPFEHTFTEPPGSDGYLGIQVAAASKQAGRPAVTCRITVNDVVVSEQSSAEADDSGLAQVLCTVPRDV